MGQTFPSVPFLLPSDLSQFLRVFFLHDGRTKDLLDAIQQHASPGSEANGVIRNFQNNLTPQQQQDLLNFLCSL